MSIHHLPSQRQSLLLKLQIQTTLSSHPKSSPFLLPICRSGRWNLNTESLEKTSFNYNFKKNESATTKYFHEIDEDVEEDDNDELWTAVLEQYIDSIWILKVFGSYGWSLPFIMLSLLLASGLKAFLMALALPLAQSTIWFLLQMICGSTNSRVRRGSRAITEKKDKNEKRAYPPWVPGKVASTDNRGNDGDSNFGGWDQLDFGRDLTRGSPKSDQTAIRSQGRHFKKDNFSRLERRSDAPLLLMLLVAVFPFFGWWIKIF